MRVSEIREKRIRVNQGLFVRHKKFGLAQNILRPIKGQGITYLFMPGYETLGHLKKHSTNVSQPSQVI